VGGLVCDRGSGDRRGAHTPRDLIEPVMQRIPREHVIARR
jgi:hypothetical protein